LHSGVCTGAVEAVISALLVPPGRTPSSRDVRLSRWFNEQQRSIQGNVREIVNEAVRQATFNLLAVLDGVAPLTEDSRESQFELFSVHDNERVLLNQDTSEELHRLFSQSRTAAERRSEPALKAYDVGAFSELKMRQTVSDSLHLHRVPVKFVAKKTIDGYDAGTAPCIALPPGEHLRVESSNDELERR
jgi:hypothetical protein